MLMWAIPLVVFVVAFFIVIAIVNRGNWADALGFGAMWAIGGLVVSALVLPVVVGRANNEVGVRWQADVLGNIEVYQNTEFDSLYLKFALEGYEVQDVSVDDMNIHREDITTPYVIHKCNEIPDLVVPYTLDTCWDELHIPIDMELSLKVIV